MTAVPAVSVYLKEEMTLIEMNGLIKTVLGREHADVKGCIGLLERFQLLNLTPLMLLKNPAVVGTIKRLRRYVGNTEYWGYTEEEIVEFNEKANRIRVLAEDIYQQIKVGCGLVMESHPVNPLLILIFEFILFYFLSETLPNGRGNALLDGLQRVVGEADGGHARPVAEGVCEPVRTTRVAEGLVAAGQRHKD